MCTKLCCKLHTSQKSWQGSLRGTEGTRLMLNPGSQSRVWGAKTQQTADPKVCFLLGIPTNPWWFVETVFTSSFQVVPFSGIFGKAGWILSQGLDLFQKQQNFFLAICFSTLLFSWSDCEEAGNVCSNTVIELDREWTVANSQSATFQSYHLAGEFLFCFISPHAYIKKKFTQIKQLKKILITW